MSDATPIELRYVEQGRGPAVLLLHGFPLDGTMWEEQVDVLAGRFRVIVPDLRGHGRSPAPPGPYTMDQHVADVAALLDRLGIERAALVGLSMGGYITLNFVAAHPGRVWAVVLADTRAPGDAEETKRTRAEQARLVRSGGLEHFIEMQIPRMIGPLNLARRPEVADRYREIVRRARPESIAAALDGLAARPSMTATLERISQPTLVIVGSEDAATPPADARQLADLIPGARLEIIEGAGHMSNWEAPARFNQVLVEFLENAARE